MKGKLGFFIFGLFVGAVLAVFAFVVYTVGINNLLPMIGVSTSTSEINSDGYNLFVSDGATIPGLQVRVFQTLGPTTALAEVSNERYSYGGDYSYIGALVVVLANEGEYSIYDDLRIDIPSNKKLVQIGTYRYQTIEKQWKTVPVVKIK